MRHKLLDATLLLIALVGGVVVLYTSREQGRVRAKSERLSRSAGNLVITDPSKVHVLALDTGEPLHFAWRVYLPADYELFTRVMPAASVGSLVPGTSPARELILRVRFREDSEGDLNLYQSRENSSSRQSFGDPALSKVLHGRFDKVLVEQLGTHGAVSVGMDEPLDLLSLTVPADLETEVRNELSPDRRARFDPRFFRFSFRPEPKQTPQPSVEN